MGFEELLMVGSSNLVIVVDNEEYKFESYFRLVIVFAELQYAKEQQANWQVTILLYVALF